MNEKLQLSLDAGFPLIYIRSFEESKVDEILKKSMDGRRILKWDEMCRCRDLKTGEIINDCYDLNDALREGIEEREFNRKIFVIKDIVKYLNNAETVTLLKNACVQIETGTLDTAIILVSPIVKIPKILEEYVTIIGLNNSEVELENSDVEFFVENNIEFVGFNFKEKERYKESKTRKLFPTELKESFSLQTHKGKFYNGVFYGFTSNKIIICKDSKNVEEKEIGENSGDNQVNIIALDVDEHKIGILSYTKKNGYTVYELSGTDYTVIKKYSVYIYLQNAYQRNLHNGKYIVSLNVKEKIINVGLGCNQYVPEKDNFPQYLIINYETQEVIKHGYFSLNRGGGYKIKEYGNKIFLLSARDGEIFSSENQFNKKLLYTTDKEE